MNKLGDTAWSLSFNLVSGASLDHMAHFGLVDQVIRAPYTGRLTVHFSSPSDRSHLMAILDLIMRDGSRKLDFNQTPHARFPWFSVFNFVGSSMVRLCVIYLIPSPLLHAPLRFCLSFYFFNSFTVWTQNPLLVSFLLHRL